MKNEQIKIPCLEEFKIEPIEPKSRRHSRALGRKFARFLYSYTPSAFVDGFFEMYRELWPSRFESP